MAFPTSSLTNNQVHKEGNRAFVYDSALGVWDQVRETDRTENKILQGEIGSGVTGFTGIKEQDIWRLHTNVTGTSNSATIIGSNLERYDNADFEKIGAGMSQSGGIFTFPSTGKWLITSPCRGKCTTSGGSSWIDIMIYTTSGTNAYRSIGTTGAYANSVYFYVSSEFVFDVTNVSTCFASFYLATAAACTYFGSGNDLHTYFTFTRLGDT